MWSFVSTWHFSKQAAQAGMEILSRGGEYVFGNTPCVVTENNIRKAFGYGCPCYKTIVLSKGNLRTLRAYTIPMYAPTYRKFFDEAHCLLDKERLFEDTVQDVFPLHTP